MAKRFKAGDNVLKLHKTRPEKRFEPWLFGPLMFESDEEEARFESLRLEYHARYKPIGTIEEEYVDDIVDIVWRQRRMCELELVVLETMMGMVEKDTEMPVPGLNTICRYKDQLDRSMKLTLKALEDVKLRRQPGEKPSGRDMPHPAELKWLAEQLRSQDHTSEPETEELAQQEPPSVGRPNLRLIED